ncbi:hypothetical protein WMW71_02460 [Flavobacterium buctense]|uniref:Lipoprotein n=1 Tax=Flavobacterium buctense TaxID=1648146 RepID=A0ABU9DY91_9FLAO|nr:hypothetical protein [Flavobacterium buctense]
MKNLITVLLLALLSGCSNDSNSNPEGQLPPITQTGANTFGVTIKGKVYIPRDPTGVTVGPQGHGVIFTGSDIGTWREIIVVDGASAVGFKMVIHFKDLVNQGVGTYQLKQSDFHDNIDSAPIDHIYFKIWDDEISNYAYYGSVENQGEIKVTKRDSGILSGTFKGIFARYNTPTDIIEITDGRFDFNLNTLPTTIFL